MLQSLLNKKKTQQKFLLLTFVIFIYYFLKNGFFQFVKYQVQIYLPYPGTAEKKETNFTPLFSNTCTLTQFLDRENQTNKNSISLLSYNVLFYNDGNLRMVKKTTKATMAKPVSRSKAMITVARQNATSVLEQLNVDLGNG